MDVAKELKDKGYTKQAAKQQGITWRMFECFETNTMPKKWNSINVVCTLLCCQPEDFIGYSVDEKILYLRYNIMELLKSVGIDSVVAVKKGLSSGTQTLFRQKKVPQSWETIGILCDLLECLPASLLEWVPDKSK